MKCPFCYHSIHEDFLPFLASLKKGDASGVFTVSGDLDNHNLAYAIDKVIEDTSYQRAIRENLHYLREIGGFGAHTQRDQTTGEIIDIGHDEAEWTLDVIDGLFDYFIVGPAKNTERQAGFESKMQACRPVL